MLEKSLKTAIEPHKPAPDELSVVRAELRPKKASLSAPLVDKAYRTLRRCVGKADLRIAWLGNHTLDPVVRHAAVKALINGVVVDDLICPFNQHFQAILDDDSELFAFEPSVVVLWLSMRGLCPELVEGGGRLTDDMRQARADGAFNQVTQWVDAAKERTSASLFVCNFARPPSPRLGVGDNRVALGDAALYSRLNLRLADFYRNDPQVFVLDVDHAVSEGGRRKGWNPRLYRLARIEWDGAASASIGKLIGRSIRALVKPPAKCLVLDLDNTLWGGVIGEDGVAGVKIAPGDPVGESYRAFQAAVLDLKQRGVLLAICSKNNAEDVEAVFDKLSMPLRMNDFAAVRINWKNKHENLEDIARELNIGTDSLVFVDDNAAECELIRQMLPEVMTLQLPGDPADAADALIDLPDFDKLVITDDDLRKTEQYLENKAREERRLKSPDLTSYLESLGTQLVFAPVTPERLARIHQLFSKTNQFNCTTKRYTSAELERFMQAPDWHLECVSASDNFGELGTIGTFLLRLGDEETEIDSFVLSCRAMGRGIETAMCNRIKDIANSGSRSERLTAAFLPTKKNAPAAGFYPSQGFEFISDFGKTGKLYGLSLEDGDRIHTPGIDIEVQEQ